MKALLLIIDESMKLGSFLLYPIHCGASIVLNLLEKVNGTHPRTHMELS